jgi:hypothetical protein
VLLVPQAIAYSGLAGLTPLSGLQVSGMNLHYNLRFLDGILSNFDIHVTGGN